MAPILDPQTWLREQCAEYEVDLRGVYRRRGDHSWPLTANSEHELEEQLASGGHFLPLPKESAAHANVLEVSLVEILLERLERLDGALYALTYNNRASRPAYERLLREIEAAGYSWRARVLNAADYGVPQARPRLFTIGVPKGKLQPELPDPTHGGRWERRHTGHDERGHVTTGEALAGLVTEPEPSEMLRGQYGHLLHDIPPGENYLHYTAERGHPDPRFEWRKRYWSFLLKLDPSRPSPTIQAQPGPNVGPFHWDNRRLRVGEVKRLFTFPDEFGLVGSRSSVQSQLGNSVPPRLAASVIDQISHS